MAWTQNSDIELKGVQFQAFFIISGQIKGRVGWCMVAREAWRPKVGGGAGACPMASIIRAFPAILPLLWLYLYPHNICPFLFRTDSNCVQSQRAWSDGGFVPSSSQVRVPVFVALPTTPLVPPPPSVVPSCPPQLYVFRSGSGSPDTQLYTTHSFIDSRELLFLEIVCQNTFALPCKFLFLCIVQYKAISR